MDISMPGMDGYEASTAIRNHLGPTLTAIVGATGFNRKDILEKAKKAGMGDVLTKPITKPALEALVQAYLP